MSGLGLNSSSNFAGETFVRFKETCGCGHKFASRVRGLSAIDQRLTPKNDGYGGLVIFRGCRNLIRTLPAMVYSRTNPEDIDDSCEHTRWMLCGTA